MGICKICGKDAGWFKDVHAECAQLVETGSQQIIALVKQALTNGTPFTDIKTSFDGITGVNRVPADRARQILLQSWSDTADELGVAEPLSKDKYAAMLQFSRDAGLDPAGLAQTKGGITASVSAVLWRVMNGDLKDLPAIAHPFNLSGNEVPLLFIEGVIYGKDTVTRIYHTSYSGMSFNVGMGIYQRFGTSERTEQDKFSLNEVDRGSVLFTTNNIYFGGAHKAVRIGYEHVVEFRFAANGLMFVRDRANAVLEAFQVMAPWSPACGQFMFNLGHFLAQPEARKLYGGGRSAAHRAADDAS